LSAATLSAGASQAAAALADSDSRWRELSESGDFDRESATAQSGWQQKLFAKLRSTMAAPQINEPDR
jgi:hypothetical protein